MDGVILDRTQFAAPGLDKIPMNNVQLNDIGDVIVEWEKYYLFHLLSNNLQYYPAGGLADLFIADAIANAGVPATARFAFIFNAFNMNFGDRIYSSKGMLRTFKSLIYYHYVTEILSSYIATGGVTSGDASASKTPNMANIYRQAESRFNDALESIESIRWWIQSGNGIAAIGGGGGGASEYPEYLRPSYQSKDVFKSKFQSIM